MTTPHFDWRPVAPADLPVLAALYRAAAQALGPLVYTPAQVAAWASFAADAAGFERYVLEADTWVADDAKQVLGFCGVACTGNLGELRSLYVTPDHTRRGIGTTMLARTLDRAQAAGVARFAAWATPLSRPVFEAAGFVLAHVVSEPFAGTLFERYRVERG
jgi:GNAT superfamily N-acetyltransferase